MASSFPVNPIWSPRRESWVSKVESLCRSRHMATPRGCGIGSNAPYRKAFRLYCQKPKPARAMSRRRSQAGVDDLSRKE